MSLWADKLKELFNVENQAGIAEGAHQATLISVCSQKGGVGKTTTTVNLAVALAQFHGKKVAVVDLDPQGHVEKSLGAILPEGVEYTTLSTLLTQKKGNILSALIPTEIENFFLTPGDKALSESENILAAKIGKEYILSEAIRPALSHFDFILFDCPPNLGNLTLNALVCSHYCLVPCEMSVLAFEGVHDLVETLELINERLNPKLRILGVVFTRVDRRNVSMNEVIEKNIRNYFHDRVFETRIAVNTALNKAQLEGKPVFQSQGSSSGAQNYRQLAEEVLKKLNPQAKAVKKSKEAVKKAG